MCQIGVTLASDEKVIATIISGVRWRDGEKRHTTVIE